MIRYLLFFVLPFPLTAQYALPAEKVAASIEAASIREHVFVLASPELQGRETGTPGNEQAAAYIASQFSAYGIPALPGKDSYFQEVQFSNVKWDQIELKLNGESVEHLKGFLSIPQNFSIQDGPINIKEMMFLGYGIDHPGYSDYEHANVAGKHLLVYGGEPLDTDGKSRITGTDTLSEWSVNPELKMEAARRHGAASVWIIEDNFRELVMYARKNLLNGATLMGSPATLTENILPHAIISSTVGQQLTGDKINKVIRLRDKITKTGKSKHTVLATDLEWTAVHQIKSTPGVNVLAYIEGTDPLLRHELVIVTAHFDHLGMRGKDIFFGADDNASGTSAVMEIAQAFAIAKTEGYGPRRSVLCMLVTGEEKGLLGSQYYAEHPIFPIENTVANVNIDMIGRTDDKHTTPNYTYVIGSDRLSTELHEINETVNRQFTNLELDYTYNRDDDPNRFYYRSDHYNFAKRGIPAIFYFSGVHADYHRPTDTPDKLMYDKAETIARLAFHTAWELANRDERIKVNVTGRN